MTVRIQGLVLALCLLLRRACGDVQREDMHLVDGLIDQHITLPCTFTIPDNWKKKQEIHITWYKNFTTELLKCSVKDERTPVCQKHPDSSRLQLSWKYLGNADLDIYRLQESDGGPYQCWIVFDDTYQRQDTLLNVDSDGMSRRQAPPPQRLGEWQEMLVVSTWDVLLLIGWPIAVLLSGVLIYRRFSDHRKKRFTVI